MSANNNDERQSGAVDQEAFEKVIRDNLSPEAVAERPDQATFIAETVEPRVIGFANGGPQRDSREEFRGELYGLYVLPDSHGRGIGRRLVATFARWLIDSGFDTMLVWVLADNPFRRFYERLGGTLVEERKIQIGRQTLGEVAYGWNNVTALVEGENAS
jgi:GNAT superfamily N-acetyltransferase